MIPPILSPKDLRAVAAIEAEHGPGRVRRALARVRPDYFLDETAITLGDEYDRTDELLRDLAAAEFLEVVGRAHPRAYRLRDDRGLVLRFVLGPVPPGPCPCPCHDARRPESRFGSDQCFPCGGTGRVQGAST